MNKIIFLILYFLLFDSLQAQSLRSIISNGNDFYKDEKYNDADVEYLKAVEKNKNEVYGYFNRGNSLYKQNNDSVAQKEYFTALSKTENKKIKSELNYNLGNIELKNKNYEKAIEEYKNSLRQNPNDEDAKYNLGYALQQIALMKKDSSKQNQQQNKNNKNEKDKNQNQNQNQEQKQNKNEQSEKKQTQSAQKKSNISKENAERILHALKEDEKKVQKKLKKQIGVKLDIEKDW